MPHCGNSETRAKRSPASSAAWQRCESPLTEPAISNVIPICMSCMRARATRKVEFAADAKRPAATYLVCYECAMDANPKGVVSAL